MTATDTGIDPDLAHAAVEHCYEQGWSDGLPVVPASRSLVDRFLATTDLAPETGIGRLPQLDRVVTVELAAINAVMAGCRPEYFPVVLAAWEALMAERATGGGGWQSTSGPAPLIVVNGPVRDRLAVNSTGGVFGPGFRANATIARAIGLIVRNVFGIHPHGLEQATQGLPGRWTICIGENEEESPWEPLAAEAGIAPGTSAVSATLLRTCEYVDNRHTGSAEQLLGDFADTLARTGAWIFQHAGAGIVFCPEHAQQLAAAGYDRDGIRAWLHEHSVRSTAELARAGKDGLDGRLRLPGASSASGSRISTAGSRGEGADRVLAGPERENLLIAVAGARNAGISMVVRQFSGWSGTAVPLVAAGETR
ncbi:hypothetical protein WIS52_03690 [Pseudonocardia nematodicida]|uniref:Uncharacterized protein n=1 Tax=Pseudonocardia nematodicida TaxID=1206997 RepID=A0ABV1K535_9PSEU